MDIFLTLALALVVIMAFQELARWYTKRRHLKRSIHYLEQKYGGR